METWIYYAIAGGIFLIWILLNLKTSRPDGTYIKGIHKYRQMMLYIFKTRNESVVYFDEYIDATNLLAYLDEAKTEFDCNVTHAIVASCAFGFTENPSMNYFVKGYRLYKRKGTYLSFSMKRAKLDKKAKLSVVKLKITDDMTFRSFCEETNAQINKERSGERTYADKEFDLFGAIPRPIFLKLLGLFKAADYYNILPGSFIENDPLYTSMFIANLGSLGMGAGFHHLYEWGTCPLFMMAGKIEERQIVIDGEAVIKPMMHIRFSYDERIDDGLTASHGIATFKEILENPADGLGCIKSDGSDAYKLNVPRSER